MSTTRAPYQNLQVAENFLVAARGSSIDLFSLQDISLLSTWTCPIPQNTSNKPKGNSGAQQSSVVPNAEASESSPPSKRRKLSEDGATQKSNDADIQGKKKQNNRSESVVSGLEAPAVTSLAVSARGHHVIAVTGEDKSIRVFKISWSEDGKHYLEHLSQRSVTKLSDVKE